MFPNLPYLVVLHVIALKFDTLRCLTKLYLLRKHSQDQDQTKGGGMRVLKVVNT